MNEKLYHDLDQACLKTIVALLHQLPLQPLEPAQEGQLSQVKSRIFYKYFTFFLKLLNRCKNIEVKFTLRKMDMDHLALTFLYRQTRAIVDSKSANGIKPNRVSLCKVDALYVSQPSYYRTNINACIKTIENPKDLEPLKNYTILAMSNLLSANVDAGLKYSLTMGYHEDTRTRAAFMQVLTNILKQGTEFDTLAEDFEEERNERLVKVSETKDGRSDS
jgi:neurofibromin 1